MTVLGERGPHGQHAFDSEDDRRGGCGLLAAPASAVFAAEAVTSKVAFTDGAGDVWRMDGVTTPTQV